jgi:hypothetical protein
MTEAGIVIERRPTFLFGTSWQLAASEKVACPLDPHSQAPGQAS